MADLINAVDKRYIYKSVSNVRLTGSNIFDSQMQTHTSNQNNDVILAEEFQQNLTKEHRKNGVIDHGKFKKIIMKIK